MKIAATRLSVIAACALVAACRESAAPTPAGYAGQWSGTTAQGRPISFTIAGEAVTTLTVGHDFNGCSGSQTFSGLSLSIVPNVICPTGPCPPSLSSYRAFGYGSGGPIDGPSLAVNAVFLSMDRAEGTVNFRGYPGCGNAIGVGWMATRR
jgi:hypothetical protein